VPTLLGASAAISGDYREIVRFLRFDRWQRDCFQVPRGRFIMGLLMLIGFGGAIIVLGFLSCLAGGSSERKHMRNGSDMPEPKWQRRR
jgi:hypothetical protein